MKPYDYIKQLLEIGTVADVEVSWWDVIYKPDRPRLECDEDYVNSLPISKITPIPRVPKLLPVGTKVRVFEEYKSKKVDKTLVYTIYWMNFENYNLLISISEDWEDIRIPARAVYPIWEREE